LLTKVIQDSNICFRDRAFSKRYLELLQADGRGERGNTALELIPSFVHLLHSLVPAPQELFVELTRRGILQSSVLTDRFPFSTEKRVFLYLIFTLFLLLISSNSFVTDYQSFIVLSSLQTIVESNIKLSREDQWISSIFDTLIAGTDFRYAAESITSRPLSYTPLLAQILLQLLLGDKSRSQYIPSRALNILGKRLSEFSKALQSLGRMNAFDPLVNVSSKSPVFSPLGSTVSFKLGEASLTSSIETFAPLFQVGDRVDGLVQLANGSQRWYPGTISSGAINLNENIFMY